MSAPISDEALFSICSLVDDVWVTFDEIALSSMNSQGRHNLRRFLQAAIRHGYISSRISDAHYRTEYAITEAGDAFVEEYQYIHFHDL